MVAVFAFALLCAAGLYHFVEEPARIWMRRMVKERKLPVADPHSEAPDPAQKLQPIHGPRQVPAKPVTARAG
jgi:peptidoglycan/LPS O-acetylase OafA/YrhL